MHWIAGRPVSSFFYTLLSRFFQLCFYVFFLSGLDTCTTGSYPCEHLRLTEDPYFDTGIFMKRKF